MSRICGSTGRSSTLRMLALLLYLGSNVLRGFVLVRLLEGDLHLLVTIHELTQLSNCRGQIGSHSHDRGDSHQRPSYKQDFVFLQSIRS